MASPNIKITLDKPRVLRFGFQEAAEFEEQTGKSIFAGLRDQPFMTLRFVISLGMRWYDQTITTKKAGELVQTYLSNGGQIEALSDAISAALKASGVFRETEQVTDVDETVVDDAGNASAGDPA